MEVTYVVPVEQEEAVAWKAAQQDKTVEELLSERLDQYVEAIATDHGSSLEAKAVQALAKMSKAEKAALVEQVEAAVAAKAALEA